MTSEFKRIVWVSCCTLVLVLVGCRSHTETDGVLSYYKDYQRPLVSPGTQFAALPPAVQHTIRAEAGTEEIVDITTFTNAQRVIYKVWFANSRVSPPLYLGADGSVLNPDLGLAVGAPADSFDKGTSSARSSALNIADLVPAAVMKVLETRGNVTDVARITKQTWGDRPVYKIAFRDGERNPTLYVTADGTVLNEVEH